MEDPVSRQDDFGPRTPRPRAASLLSPRERQIVRLIAEGCTNAQIAARLHLKPQTVKNQLTAIYEKLHVKNRLELALHAVRHGLQG
jgi:DNA-binding NarL/FixJ family response regulator